MIPTDKAIINIKKNKYLGDGISCYTDSLKILIENNKIIVYEIIDKTLSPEIIESLNIVSNNLLKKNGLPTNIVHANQSIINTPFNPTPKAAQSTAINTATITLATATSNQPHLPTPSSTSTNATLESNSASQNIILSTNGTDLTQNSQPPMAIGKNIPPFCCSPTSKTI